MLIRDVGSTRAYHVPTESARKYIAAGLAVEGRVRHRSHRMSVHEIVSAYKDGYTIEQLVNTSGRNLPFIHCVLTEHGLLPKETALACDGTAEAKKALTGR